MKATLASLLTLVLISALGFSALSQQISAESEAEIVAEIATLVNNHRQSIGLGTLTVEPIISKISKEHSKNMAKNKVAFSHDGFEDRAKLIMKDFGGNSFAENIAYGQLSAKEVTNGWLNSKGHKANIEGNYNYIGIGIYPNKDGVIYFTQIFVKK